MTADRATRVIETFATLADTLVEDYDVVELLQTLVETCADVLDISAAGIMLANPHGELEVIASTSEASRLIEVLQLDAEAGPCLTCYASGETVSCADISLGPDEWRDFRTGALDLGFRSVHAVPLRLRSTLIGTLNLFGAEVGTMTDADLRIARALADVATIGIMHERTLREHDAAVSEQLRNTIGSREIIEQAKGVVSYTQRISIEDAFTVIRQHAHDTNERISNVARAVIERHLRL